MLNGFRAAPGIDFQGGQVQVLVHFSLSLDCESANCRELSVL